MLELAKHITLHVNGEPLLKWSSSHSSPVPQRFFLLSGLPNLLNDDTLPMRVCNRKCVIIPNKKILDLLNQESISGACSAINSTRNLPRVFEKVSQPLKYHSIFFAESHMYIHVYIYI